MAQKLIQTQTQQQVQQQRLSQQQMLQVKLLEMPLAELEQNINAELDDNPALEEKRDDFDDIDGRNDEGQDSDSLDDDPYEDKSEKEEREEALDNALESLASDDDMPEPTSRNANNGAEQEEIVWGDTTSFYDKLKEQMGEMEPHRSSTTSWSTLSDRSTATDCCANRSTTSPTNWPSTTTLTCQPKRSSMCSAGCSRSTRPASEPGRCRNVCCCR